MQQAKPVTCSKVDISSKVHKNTLNYYTIPHDAAIQAMPTIDLLTTSRFDIMARYLWARSSALKLDTNASQEAYKQFYTKQANGFEQKREYDPGKFSLADYVDQFENLIKSVENNYDLENSIIPTCNDAIIDGAHRVAAALAFDVPQLLTVKLDGPAMSITYDTLQKWGVSEDTLDWMAFEFCRLKQQSRVFVLYPCIGTKSIEEQTSFLKDTLDVFYTKDVHCTANGLKNLLDLLYGHHEWWADFHACNYQKARAKSNVPVRFVFYHERSNDQIRHIKEDLRAKTPFANNAAHSTDTHEELLLIAEAILNKNAVHRMNYAVRNKVFPIFAKNFAAYHARIADIPHKDCFCVESSSVLALYGLRDANDVDYLVSNDAYMLEENSMYSSHNNEYTRLNLDYQDVISNPEKHFYYRSVKFASLQEVAKMKSTRQESKDFHDLYLIRHVSSISFGMIVYKCRCFIKSVLTSVFWKIWTPIRNIAKIILPQQLYRKLFLLKEKIKKL